MIDCDILSCYCTCQSGACGGTGFQCRWILLLHSFDHQVSDPPLVFILCVTEKSHGRVIHLKDKFNTLIIKYVVLIHFKENIIMEITVSSELK